VVVSPSDFGDMHRMTDRMDDFGVSDEIE